MHLLPFRIKLDTMNTNFIDMKTGEYCDIRIEGEILTEDGKKRKFTFTKGNINIHNDCEDKARFTKETTVQLENCLISYTAGLQMKKVIIYNTVVPIRSNDRSEIEE